MSTYKNSIGEFANESTSHYNRDDEYSRRAASISHNSQSLVGDILSDRARSSRKYQTESTTNGMMESDLTATHMRPSEIDQQYVGKIKKSSMDLFDYSREQQNEDFEYMEDLTELEEPNSSRNGAIQGAVENRSKSRFSSRARESETCKKKIIYSDVGGIITPTEIKLNKYCVDERFGGPRERSVPLRLKVPSLSGPGERMSDLVFETKRDNYDFNESEYFDMKNENSAENKFDNQMINEVLDRAGLKERAGVIGNINKSDKTFELDRMNIRPSERFNDAYFRSKARNGSRGVSRFNADGEAYGACNCEQPGCPDCNSSDKFYGFSDNTSSFYNGGEAFY